ncbi:MAG: hypothetical protein QM698_03765 [Micropepsaceae bacterium]
MRQIAILGAASAALLVSAMADEPAWTALPEITLQPDRLPGMCATVNADGVAESRACTGAADQRFRAPGPDGGVLRYGDLCMSAPDEGNYPELRAVPCGSGGDHYWIVDHKGRLANNAGRCLQVLGGSSREGATVFGARCLQDDPSPYTFRFAPADEAWDQRTDAAILMGDACLAWQEAGNFFKADDCAAAPYAAFSYAVNRPGQIRARSSCLRAYIDGAPLNLGDCHDTPDTMWVIDGGHLMNGSGRCALPDDKGVLRSGPCPATAGDFRFP